MGWVHESDTHLHEAALVPFFDDGSVSHGSTMVDGVDYEVVEIGRRPNDDRRRPSAEIVGWLLRCDCASRSSSDVSTWTDPVQWTRVPSASLEDLAVGPSTIYFDEPTDDWLEEVCITGRRTKPRIDSRSAIARYAVRKLMNEMTPQQVIEAIRAESAATVHTKPGRPRH